MPNPGAYNQAVEVNGEVYVFGGKNGSTKLRNIKKY
ncbi:hypothetical protein FE784_40355 [Paenibacillus hemerocallicola]|uniref:Galactose oxidase n=1 Tax=Paenibacillus hemerocallicola TaxID=1172614 RepID=A0A5C4SVJ0_9BACL|nr:hypothetical protein FE784_40355 [Paenibacillus hemerocallicola]